MKPEGEGLPNNSNYNLNSNSNFNGILKQKTPPADRRGSYACRYFRGAVTFSFQETYVTREARTGKPEAQ